MINLEYDVAGQLISASSVPQYLVADTVGVYQVTFTFDSDWSGLGEKTAVFRNPSVIDVELRDVPVEFPLDENNSALIPGAILDPGKLFIGVYGVNGTQQMPTIWAPPMQVVTGASPGVDAPTDPALGTAIRTAPQTLTDEEKAQARENIGAIGRVPGEEGNVVIIGNNGNIVDGGKTIADIESASDGLYRKTEVTEPIYIKDAGNSKYAEIHKLGGRSSRILQWYGPGALNFTSDSDFTNGVKFTNNGDMSYTIEVAEGGCTADVTKNLRTSTARPSAYAGHIWLIHICPYEDGNLLNQYITAGGFTGWFQTTGVLRDNWYARTVISSPGYRYIQVTVLQGCPAGTYTVKPQVIDLTQLCGAGNEPTLQNKTLYLDDPLWEDIKAYGIDPRTNYYPYVANGSLVTAKQTGISVLSESDTVVQSIIFPEEITSLEGFGESDAWNPSQYNYLDFDNQKYVEVGYYDNGTWTAKSAEVDLSEYLPKTPVFSLPDGGKLRIDQTQEAKLLPYTIIDYKTARHLVNAESIAPVEDSYTASRAYAVGNLVYVGETLYRVTAAISSGTTLTPNSNITETTVTAELMTLR